MCLTKGDVAAIAIAIALPLAVFFRHAYRVSNWEGYPLLSFRTLQELWWLALALLIGMAVVGVEFLRRKRRVSRERSIKRPRSELES